MIRILSVAFLCIATPALAQQPVVKRGSCPLGYYSQGDYCVPARSMRQEAIEKVGPSCPIGWYTQGRYCVRTVRGYGL